MRIGIVVDATCDLPQDYIERHRIVVMPISLRFGDRWGGDSRNPQATRTFYAAQVDNRKDDFAESAAFSAEQIERLFLERLVVDYDYVLCLTITKARSPIYEHALQASRAILSKYRQPRRDAGLHYIYKRASKKGDRSIGWGAYAFGTMLDVKPVLRCHQDETGPVAKVKGLDAAVNVGPGALAAAFAANHHEFH